MEALGEQNALRQAISMLFWIGVRVVKRPRFPMGHGVDEVQAG